MLWSPTLRLISRGQRPAQTDTVSLALSACVSAGDGTLRPPHYLASWRLKYNDQMFWGRGLTSARYSGSKGATPAKLL